MAERRRLSKTERQTVYNKMGGHCAYCGCEITLQQMQADHIVPLHLGGTDAVVNMLPACRSCNHYKSTLTVDKFRAAVQAMPGVLERDSVTYRNAVRFGLVTPTPHPVEFYFERKSAQKEGGEHNRRPPKQ